MSRTAGAADKTFNDAAARPGRLHMLGGTAHTRTHGHTASLVLTQGSCARSVRPAVVAAVLLQKHAEGTPTCRGTPRPDQLKWHVGCQSWPTSQRLCSSAGGSHEGRCHTYRQARPQKHSRPADSTGTPGGQCSAGTSQKEPWCTHAAGRLQHAASLPQPNPPDGLCTTCHSSWRPSLAHSPTHLLTHHHKAVSSAHSQNCWPAKHQLLFAGTGWHGRTVSVVVFGPDS